MVFCLHARRVHQISLQMIVSHHVVAGIELRTLGKAASESSLQPAFVLLKES